MSTREFALAVLLAGNFAAALLYLLWGVVIRRRIREKGEDYSASKYVIVFWIMVLCPVAGPLFFITGHLMFRLFFHARADLSDVIFSKARREEIEKDSVEGKLNIAPIEEALAVSDNANLRNLMMDVVKGNVKQSLFAISLALNSEDSETSHYAASVLCDELNEFRENVQKIHSEIRKEGSDQAECCCMLIQYMNDVLEQRVFTAMEQQHYVQVMENAGETLYQKDRERMESCHFEWICLRLLDVQEFGLAEKWCQRARVAYPNELASYTCQLKLYFNMQAEEKFFRAMNELKKSNIVIDNETLELIRTFG